MKKTSFVLLTLLALAPLRAQVPAPPSLAVSSRPAGATNPEELFALENLHAWCAVPFDAKEQTAIA